MVEFGNRLKNLRTSKNLTQKQLSEIIGVATSAISAYESGMRYPSYQVLIRIASVFHVTTDFLLGIENHSNINSDGLTQDQINAIITIVDLFRNSK